MTRRFTRRQVLRWGLIGGTAVVLPGTAFLGCGDGDEFLRSPATPTAVPSFLTAEEKAVVRALVARTIPTDDRPGAIEAGAHEYIDRLLSLVPTAEEPRANVFGGGPFSARNPFPDPKTGAPSNKFPPDHFAQFIPLTRLQLMSWRVQLLGTAAVPGSDFNTSVLGSVIGLRERYRTGIAALQSTSRKMFSADFVALTSDQQEQVIEANGTEFVSLVTDHTLEGMLCAPEYGGNTNRIGWNLCGYDGDSQPLGYSIFDETTLRYHERPDKPTSTANPDEGFSDFDEPLQEFLTIIVKSVGGPHFPK